MAPKDTEWEIAWRLVITYVSAIRLQYTHHVFVYGAFMLAYVVTMHAVAIGSLPICA